MHLPRSAVPLAAAALLLGACARSDASWPVYVASCSQSEGLMQCTCPSASDLANVRLAPTTARLVLRGMKEDVDLAALARFPQLRALVLEQVSQAHLPALRRLGQLEEIVVGIRSGEELASLASLAGLPRMRVVRVACDGEVDLGALRSLPALEAIDISRGCEPRGLEGLDPSVTVGGEGAPKPPPLIDAEVGALAAEPEGDAPTAESPMAGLGSLCDIDPAACPSDYCAW